MDVFDELVVRPNYLSFVSVRQEFRMRDVLVCAHGLMIYVHCCYDQKNICGKLP